jgi:hypothetical protein
VVAPLSPCKPFGPPDDESVLPLFEAGAELSPPTDRSEDCAAAPLTMPNPIAAAVSAATIQTPSRALRSAALVISLRLSIAKIAFLLLLRSRAPSLSPTKPQAERAH